MARRYVIPPETEKEKIFLGLTIGQLIWLSAGVLLGFGVFVLFFNLFGSVWFSLFTGIITASIVLPFIFYRPKERTMSLVTYFRQKYKVKRRINKLPNKKKLKGIPYDEESTVLSTEGNTSSKSKSVHDIDINLGGGL